MHTSGSFLMTAMDRARQLVNEPEVDALSDARIMSDAIVPAMTELWSRLILSDAGAPVLSMDLTVVGNTTHYQLPPAVAEVIRLGKRDENGRQVRDWRPEGTYSPWGPGWRVERNMIVFEPAQPTPSDWTVDYVPSGDILAHYSSAGGTLDAGLDDLTLSATPTLGTLDRRPNAYAGNVLRLIPTSGVVEERVISAYNASTGVATVYVPFTYATAGSSKAYEIVPWQWSQGVWDAVAARAAIKIATWRRAGDLAMRQLRMEYELARKTAYDLFNHVQNRAPKRYDRNTVDSSSAGPYGLG